MSVISDFIEELFIKILTTTGLIVFGVLVIIFAVLTLIGGAFAFYGKKRFGWFILIPCFVLTFVCELGLILIARAIVT